MGLLEVGTVMLASIERGAELPGTGQVALPPVLDANHTAAMAVVIAVYAGFIGALVWAGAQLVRFRDGMPMILLAAGVIAANIEPVGDTLGLIVYAPNIPWFDYTIMGRQMPSFILVGESSFVAFGGWYACRLIQQGRSLRDIGIISAIYIGIPEILVEVFWHHYGIISYYGDNPTRIFGIPLYSIVQNSTILPVFGVVTFLATTYLRGAQRLWLLVAIPAVCIGYIVGVSWPVYQAIQSDAPHVVIWLATAVTCVASVAFASAALQFPAIKALRDAAAAQPGVDAVEVPASEPVPSLAN